MSATQAVADIEPDGGGVDLTALAQCVAELNQAMRSHAGSIEVESVSDAGVVTVSFGALCAGCPGRPATLFATVRPHLLRVTGVRDVVASGVELSEFAVRRLLAFGLGLSPSSEGRIDHTGGAGTVAQHRGEGGER